MSIEWSYRLLINREAAQANDVDSLAVQCVLGNPKLFHWAPVSNFPILRTTSAQLQGKNGPWGTTDATRPCRDWETRAWSCPGTVVFPMAMGMTERIQEAERGPVVESPARLHQAASLQQLECDNRMS